MAKRQLSKQQLTKQVTGLMDFSMSLKQYFEGMTKIENDLSKLAASLEEKNIKKKFNLQERLQEAANEKKLARQLEIEEQINEYVIALGLKTEKEKQKVREQVEKQFAEDEEKRAKKAIKEREESRVNINLEKRLEEQKQKVIDYTKKVKKDGYQWDKENLKEAKAQLKETQKQIAERKAITSREERAKSWESMFSDFRKEVSLAGTGENWANALTKTLQTTMKNIGKALNNSVEQVNSAIKTYADLQVAINTRLQGTSSFKEVTDVLGTVAYSPLLSAEELYKNVQALVDQGIVTNVEQRAFFETIKDGIATTFSVNSTNLRNLIKIQHEDSTAIRLGMESYLNRFLNAFVENTEYLTTTFDSVADSLYNASAMMSSAGASAEFEYVVQKWLGALTGVGLAETTAQNIAQALGQLGSGDISGLGSGLQNLLVMASSRAGLPYSDILTGGLTAQSVNALLGGLVSYMQEIGASTNLVVKSQLANLFGLSITDFKAIQNLDTRKLATLQDNMLSVSQMGGELVNQFKTLTDREGLAKMIDNAIKNFTYQTGMDIASRPVMNVTWQLVDLVEKATGGINIPFVTAFGSGIDLNATVTGLMKLGIVGADVIAAIPKIASGATSFVDGSVLLKALGIDVGATGIKSGVRTSQKYVVGGDYESLTGSVYNEAYDKAKQDLNVQRVEELAQEDEIITYLKEMDFSTKFTQMVDNINSMANNGINITNLRGLGGSIVGLTM